MSVMPSVGLSVRNRLFFLKQRIWNLAFIIILNPSLKLSNAPTSSSPRSLLSKTHHCSSRTTFSRKGENNCITAQKHATDTAMYPASILSKIVPLHLRSRRTRLPKSGLQRSNIYRWLERRDNIFLRVPGQWPIWLVRSVPVLRRPEGRSAFLALSLCSASR